jgi:hypothetical protein
MFLGEEGMMSIGVLYFKYTFHWDSLQIGTPPPSAPPPTSVDPEPSPPLTGAASQG